MTLGAVLPDRIRVRERSYAMQSDSASARMADDLAGIRGIVFDVYGTLCRHGRRRSPFKQLLRQRGRGDGAYWLRRVMCNPMSLAQTAQDLELELSLDELDRLKSDLLEEIAAVDLFPEVPHVLSTLQSAGYKLGLVSNLALPYAEPARRLLNGVMDAEVWSFEVGSMKPELEIYSAAAEQLLIRPGQLLFVGDNPLCDVEGPRRAGMHARLVDRDGRHSDAESLSSLADLLNILPLPRLASGESMLMR